MKTFIWLERLIDRFNSKKTAFIVLLVVSFCVLIFQNDKIGFEKGHHGFLSSHGAALAKNLSAEQYFLMFTSKGMDSDDRIEFQTYGRFPVTAFLILKAAMCITGSDLSIKVAIARQVMNLFFLGALFISFLSIFELSKSYLTALSVALLSFSSAYLHYYNDMIFNDIPALFGFMLAGHGLIKYELHGKRAQMIVKALIGISLGWQVFGILFAYIISDVFRSIFQYRNIRSVFKSDTFFLGLASVIFGIFLLFYNLSVESYVTGKSFKDLNTVASAKQRFGQVDEFNRTYDEYLKLDNFSKDQMHRVGAMTIPYYVKKGGTFFLYGVLTLCFAIISGFFAKQRVLIFTFLLSGFIWAFPMKNFTFSHDFQSIFYIGIPLIFYYILMNMINRKFKIALPFAAVLTALIFIHTNIIFNMSKSASSEPVNTILNDLQKITDITGSGNTFYIDGDKHLIAEGYYTIDFCLAGNFFTDKENAEYMISRNRKLDSLLLTPDNSEIFLFRGIPRFSRSFNQRGMDYLKQENYVLAKEDFAKAIEKNPNYVEAYINMGIAEKKLQKYNVAITNFKKALSLDPENIKGLNNLAWLLSTCADEAYRDGDAAVMLSKKAVKLDFNPVNMDTMAASYAEKGEFKKAVSIQKKVIRILSDKVTPDVLNGCKKRLDSYNSRRPWRE